jgi:hypothetical protein
MNKSNSNKKNVNRSNNKKVEVPYNYRPIKISNRNFPTASQAAVYMLTHNKGPRRSQSDIARICGVSQPCVCQLARELK